jgi:hypothetical protein
MVEERVIILKKHTVTGVIIECLNGTGKYSLEDASFSGNVSDSNELGNIPVNFNPVKYRLHNTVIQFIF